MKNSKIVIGILVVLGIAAFLAGVVNAPTRFSPIRNPERALQRNAWSQHYERATLFGVYEFLERFFLCAYAGIEEEHVPEA